MGEGGTLGWRRARIAGSEGGNFPREKCPAVRDGTGNLRARGNSCHPEPPILPLPFSAGYLVAKVAGLCHHGGERMDDCRDGCKPREWRL